jgi:hypothetical protein
MIDRESTLRHHLVQVAIAERVPEIPPYAQNDHVVPEMAPAEQLRFIG